MNQNFTRGSQYLLLHVQLNSGILFLSQIVFYYSVCCLSTNCFLYLTFAEKYGIKHALRISEVTEKIAKYFYNYSTQRLNINCPYDHMCIARKIKESQRRMNCALNIV